MLTHDSVTNQHIGLFVLSWKTLAAWCGIAILFLLLLWHEPLVTRRLDFIAQDFISIQKTKLSSAVLPSSKTPPIVLVLIGERSLQAVGQWPWPRSFHAELLKKLSAARAVAFDIVMPELSHPLEDTVLATEAARHSRIFMALYLKRQENAAQKIIIPVYPYQELFDACAGVGVVNTNPDPDGAVRTTQLLWQSGDLFFPSLALAVTEMAYGQKATFIRQKNGWLLRWQKNATLQSNTILLPDLHLDATTAARFIPIAPQAAIVHEYVDVVNGTVPSSVFENAIVIVGASGAGVADAHRMAGGDFVPGAWLIAQALAGISTGQVLRLIPAHLGFFVSLLLCLGCTAAGLRSSIGKGSALALALMLVWAGVWAGTLWHSLYILPLVAPLAAASLLFGSATCWRLFSFERQWAIRTLPMEEILLLPRLQAKQSTAPWSFTEYLHETWPRITALCTLTLLEARAEDTSPLVLQCFAIRNSRIKREIRQTNKSATAHGLLVIPYCSDEAPRHRMLIPLPFSGPATYAITAWNHHLHHETLKSVAALVVSVATHYLALEEQAKRQGMLFSTIRAISGAIDAKDPITAGHSERVASLAKDIAMWLGWPEEQVEDVFFAGILHDVGKIGVPDTVLNKPGKLSDEEFLSMKMHAEKGAEIVLPIDLPSAIVCGILEHHERLDGKGYPHALAGKEISQVARILKIADVFDALVSKRQYKDPWPVSKACDLLYEQRGAEFDSQMVDVFLCHMAPEGWSAPEPKNAS